MKKLLVALTLGLSMSVAAQEAIQTSFTTVTVETSVMDWDQVNGKWMFDDNNDLQQFTAFWTFDLGEGGKGGYFGSGENVIYSVYDWNSLDEGVLINFYSHKLNEKGTLIIIVGEDGRNTMSFFMPETNRSITFYQK